MVQHFPSPISSPWLGSLTSNAARVATSKTRSTLLPVKAEHSIYLFAPICLATLSTYTCTTSEKLYFKGRVCRCDWDRGRTVADSTKRRDFRLMSSIASGSSRRSDFNPTTMIGVPGHKRFTSSNHLNHVSIARNWEVYVLLPVRFLRNPVHWLQKQLILHVHYYNLMAVVVHNLLDL